MTAPQAAAPQAGEDPDDELLDGAMPAGKEDRRLRRDALIVKHLPLVRAIANRVRENLPVQVELDDLVHAGILGLFDAVEKFDPSKKVVFHLYAKHRIRGAILDSLRQLDWASRDLRKRHKSIETTTQRLAQMLGRLPSETEVADSMGVTQERFRKQTQELFTAGLSSGQPHRVEKPDHTSFAETSQSSEQRPDELFSNHQLRGVLNRAIETLPPRYRRVIKLYYDQDRTMKQIGNELGVNESRVSQIHKTALEKLGAVLRSDGYHSPKVFLGAERRV
jgi:RNA polymerase sigma factor for flagellar operon FliA